MEDKHSGYLASEGSFIFVVVGINGLHNPQLYSFVLVAIQLGALPLTFYPITNFFCLLLFLMAFHCLLVGRSNSLLGTCSLSNWTVKVRSSPL